MAGRRGPSLTTRPAARGYGDTYSVHLGLDAATGATLAPGTCEFSAGTRQVNGVGLTLQVTKSPSTQMSEGSPNFEAASVTITAHDPRVGVEGTFTASWATDFTVDPRAPYQHPQLCFQWEGTGCTVGAGEAVPAGCTCTDHPPFVTGEVTGSFKWEF